jgi:hydrogenase expression/formation protein HypC
MCLVLPAKILEVNGQSAEVELHGGMRASVSLSVTPHAAVGQYVMVDRGLVIQVIEPGEVEAILAMYDEIGRLLAEADSAQEPAWIQGGERA